MTTYTPDSLSTALTTGTVGSLSTVASAITGTATASYYIGTNRPALELFVKRGWFPADLTPNSPWAQLLHALEAGHPVDPMDLPCVRFGLADLGIRFTSIAKTEVVDNHVVVRTCSCLISFGRIALVDETQDALHSGDLVHTSGVLRHMILRGSGIAFMLSLGGSSCM